MGLARAISDDASGVHQDILVRKAQGRGIGRTLVRTFGAMRMFVEYADDKADNRFYTALGSNTRDLRHRSMRLSSLKPIVVVIHRCSEPQMMVLTTDRLREPLRSKRGMVLNHCAQITSRTQRVSRTFNDSTFTRACVRIAELWLDGWFLRDASPIYLGFVAAEPVTSFATSYFRFGGRGMPEMTVQCCISSFIPSRYAEIDTRNIASIRLVESLGLSRVATTREADFFKGASSDEYKYAVSREDWLLLNPPRPK